jgi:peptidoglycan/LPS O-acetylase OafA/YrhL
MVLLFPFLRSYAHPLGWFDYFGWGIAVSTLIHVRAVSNPKIEKWMEPLAAVGFVGLVVLAFGCGFSTLSLSVPDVSIYIRAMQNSLWLSPLLGGCGALILFVNQLPNGSRLAQMMTARWLRWIGLVSYEWYLFHLFFITPGKAGGSLTRLIEYSLGPALISLVFSGLVFHLCSKPIMAMGKGIDH